MSQITLRRAPACLDRRLRASAQENSTSLNNMVGYIRLFSPEAAIGLMEIYNTKE